MWSNRFVIRSILKTWFSPWRAYLAEFLGTFVFVFITAGLTLIDLYYEGIGILGISIAAGFIYTVMMYATVHISGGHLNPVITTAVWLAKKIKGHLAFFYILAQLLASFAAAGMLIVIFSTDALEFSLGAPVIEYAFSGQSAIIIEAILSSILVFVFFGTMVDKQNSLQFGPLAVGMVYAVSAVLAANLSGGVINPVRAVGPAIFSANFDYLAIWTVGPLVGALFGVVYNFLFLIKEKKG